MESAASLFTLAGRDPLALRNWGVFLVRYALTQAQTTAVANHYGEAVDKLCAFSEYVPREYNGELEFAIGRAALCEAAIRETSRGPLLDKAVSHLTSAARSETYSVEAVAAWVDLEFPDTFPRVSPSDDSKKGDESVGELLNIVTTSLIPKCLARFPADPDLLRAWSVLLERASECKLDKREKKRCLDLAQEKLDMVRFFELQAAADMPTFAGFLIKKGGVRKTFKRRFFVLTRHVLTYYTDCKSAVEKGQILRSDITNVEPIENVKAALQPNTTFKIETSDRTYVLVADTSPERRGWIAALVDEALHSGPAFNPGAWEKYGLPGQLAKWEYVLAKAE